jgi:hypothetical protein
MTQSKRRNPPEREPPLKVTAVFAPPSAEGEEAWLRALKILMETEDTDDER